MSTLTSSVSSGIENPLKQLARFGQSIWLDYIRRSLMTSGDLRRMVEEDGLGGMTSNPSIFEKAIGHGDDYDELIAAGRTMLLAPTVDPFSAFFRAVATSGSCPATPG